jgi:hypothetical protein
MKCKSALYAILSRARLVRVEGLFNGFVGVDPFDFDGDPSLWGFSDVLVTSSFLVFIGLALRVEDRVAWVNDGPTMLLVKWMRDSG